MKTDQNNSSFKPKFILFGLITLALYNFLYLFIFGFDGEASFWISYVFANISIIISSVVACSGTNKVRQLTDWIFSLPIIRWCGIYVLAELAVSTLFMILDSLVPWKLTFIIQFLLPVLFMILVLPCFAQRDHIEEVSVETKENVSYIRLMHAKLLALIPRTENEALKKDIEKAADLLRHSDPMSNPSLIAIEQKLSDYVDSLDALVRASNYEAAPPIAKEICLLIAERNQLAIASKLTHH